MGESEKHRSSVARIVDWLQAHPDLDPDVPLRIDSTEFPTASSPPSIGGYVPDVFFENSRNSLTVLGEAKTARDLETDRSRKQLQAFLEYLAVCPQALFILAVPWSVVNYAKQFLLSVRDHEGPAALTIVVLSELDARYVANQ